MAVSRLPAPIGPPNPDAIALEVLPSLFRLRTRSACRCSVSGICFAYCADVALLSQAEPYLGQFHLDLPWQGPSRWLMRGLVRSITRFARNVRSVSNRIRFRLTCPTAHSAPPHLSVHGRACLTRSRTGGSDVDRETGLVARRAAPTRPLPPESTGTAGFGQSRPRCGPSVPPSP